MGFGGYIWRFQSRIFLRKYVMKPKLIVTGAGGRMGRRIIALACQDGLFDIAGAVDWAENPDIGKDVGQLAGVGDIGIELSGDYQKACDVVIDFSNPAAADATIEYCVKNKTALMMATTGLSSGQIEKLNRAAKSVPVIFASNTSLGMNLLFALVGKVAKALGEEFDIEIIEQHHRFKKDSPSGSALTLAESICKETGREFPGCIDHGRQGKDCLRQKGRVGMHSVRAGDIVGEHEIIYGALGETVKISHSAHSRDIFARGALKGAGWLVGKKAGMYTMADCLGIE